MRLSSAADPFGAPFGPIWSPIDILGSNMGWNEYETIPKMLLVDFRSITTKFQPEWTIPRPFQTIFGFWGFFFHHIGAYLDLSFDKYMSQPSNDTYMSQPGG